MFDVMVVALYAFMARNRARPRTLYVGLTNLPTVIDKRYVPIEKDKPGGVRSTVVLDAFHNMRAIYSGTIPTPPPMYHKGLTRRLLRFVDGGVCATTSTLHRAHV